MTRRTDVRDELQDGWEPSPMPPVAPDGSLELPKLRVVNNPPPRLCEAGPCRHYHRFAIQLEAQSPIGARIQGDGDQHGRIVGEAAGEFRVQVHHYCYPTAGVETALGELPVMSCSLWEPLLPSDAEQMESRRATFMNTPGGRKYTTELEAWTRARHEEQRAADAIEDAIAEAERARDQTKETP